MRSVCLDSVNSSCKVTRCSVKNQAFCQRCVSVFNWETVLLENGQMANGLVRVRLVLAQVVWKGGRCLDARSMCSSHNRWCDANIDSKNVHVDANGDNDEEEELDYVSQFACIEAMQMHCMNSFNRIRCQFWILHSQYNQWIIIIIYHLQTYKFDQIYIHCWTITVRRWHILDHKHVKRPLPRQFSVPCLPVPEMSGFVTESQHPVKQSGCHEFKGFPTNLSMVNLRLNGFP